jgi:BlaI family transcriptional regulator, penicillinase repressor
MASKSELQLSRRERQIMDIIYERGQASVTDVHQAMPDRPSYSAVRALMRILEEKGHLKHRVEGIKYVYLPTRSHADAGKSAARRLVDTFFDGSIERAVAALIQASQTKLAPDELDRLTKLIRQARKEGR